MRRIDTAGDIEAGLAALAVRDARLARIIAPAGPVPLRRKPPGFAALVHIILSQVVTEASAAALWSRLEAATGEIEPRAVLALSPETTKAVGLSRGKAETLARISEAVITSRLDLDHLCTIDAQAALAEMTAIKGVGPWTAQVYLLVCAGHPDVFPAGDVALRSAAAHALELGERPSIYQLSDMAVQWSPWRSVAARLLWAYYARVMRRDAIPVSG